MSDELLQELARVARERQKAEARWEGLAAGTLTEEERLELERLAAQQPEAGLVHDALRPLEDAARGRIVARLEQELAQQERPPARVVSLVGRLRRVGPAVVAALAAGLALFVLVPTRGGPPVPDYALSLSGEQQVRSDAPPPEVARLGPDSRLTLLLRPQRPVEGPVQARAFLLRPGEARAWTLPLEVSAEGAMRLRGLTRELLPDLAPGEWTLAIAVGRPDALPTEAAEVARLVESGQAPDGEAWQLLTRTFLLTDTP